MNNFEENQYIFPTYI